MGRKDYSAAKTVRQAKRIADRMASAAQAKDESERWSAAWHRLDDAGRSARRARAAAEH